MSKRKIVIGVGIVALAMGCYALRPDLDLLFINTIVSEEFPGGPRSHRSKRNRSPDPLAILKC